MSFLLPILFLFACSDDIELPGPIAGGGVHAGEGDRLVLHAIDDISGLPIAGAAVSIGGSSMGTTDANGALAIESPGAPPFSISMSAPGHRTTEWTGVMGRQVTIPLRPDAVPMRPITITWSGFTMEPGTSYSVYAEGTFPRESIALDTDIPSADAFIDLTGPEPIDVAVPYESKRVFAFLFEHDDAGTPVRLDDSFTIVGFGISAEIDTTTTDAMVAAVPGSSLIGLTVGFGSLPPDLVAADVIGVPGLAFDNTQVVLFPPLVTLEGPQPGAIEGAGAYWLVGDAYADAFSSRVIARTLAAGTLADPTALVGGDFLAPPRTNTLPNGARFWVIEEDDRRTVAFTETFEPFPTGSIVRAVAGTIDPANFEWRSVTDSITAVSAQGF